MSRKEAPRQITVAEMAPHVHSFGVNENKVDKISAWLANWIKKTLQEGSIKPYDFLPSKGDLAFHIGVSKGTMQNVFRRIEDLGLVESKQKVGTYITDKKSARQDKLTSKREAASEKIKQFILDQGYTEGTPLISTRKLSEENGFSVTTICSALSLLAEEGIITKKRNTFVIVKTDFQSKNVEYKTLAEKTADKIQNYIDKNCKYGDKLPSNIEFCTMFNVSIKTVHDALKLLYKQGVLNAKRGRYGTIVIPPDFELEPYFYEQVELKIKHFISTECQIGSKLPSVRELARQLRVSSKTIKNALNILADDGYLTFTRGRYGGTFVTDIPAPVKEAYTWLALNPDYINPNEN